MLQNRIHNFFLPSTYLQASALVGSPTPIVYGDPIRISIFIPVLPTTRYPIQCIIVARSCGTSTGLPMWASIPARSARSLSSANTFAVSAMIGRCFRFSFFSYWTNPSGCLVAVHAAHNRIVIGCNRLIRRPDNIVLMPVARLLLFFVALSAIY